MWVLLQAADLIESSGWCQAVVATDADGAAVPLESGKAVCFCMLGACNRIVRYLPPGERGVYGATLDLWRRAHPTELSMPNFNDRRTTTREAAVASLRAAAKAA